MDEREQMFSRPKYALFSMRADAAGNTVWDYIGYSSELFAGVYGTLDTLATGFARAKMISVLGVVDPTEPGSLAKPSLYFVQPDVPGMVYKATPSIVAGVSPRVDTLPLNGFGRAFGDAIVQTLPIGTIFVYQPSLVSTQHWVYVAQLTEPFLAPAVESVLRRLHGLGEVGFDPDSVGVSNPDGSWSVFQRDHLTVLRIA